MLDERQVAVRNRITISSFALTLILMLLNGFFTDVYRVWGSGIDQAMALVWVAMVAVTVQSVWQGAYFTSATHRRQIMVTMGVLIVLFLAATVRDLAQHRLSVWTNGHAGSDFVKLLILAYLLITVATTAARTGIDRRYERDE
ncbi:hypothetical protein [Allobranchiibius sp. CTAmp26]|uniref:hypothetical protein n=1 Tax=Allobranchiibius sp. CTAmp26 TaxID=2815214 RepID=UPI001AA154A5|nr:hypothetical protein [Allobranchiibius sp. CTAmp26]MBO1756897.1 hypothetical protein [Allobranchiibius sp. CTAmp26]